jgi:4-hydroxy-tetrahydrodipicolinate synthase
MQELRGVIASLVTPFTPTGDLALDLLENHVEYLIESNIHGLGVCSSAGELDALSFGELVEVYRAVARRSAGRLITIGGVGGRSTREAIQMAKAAETSGLDAILVLPPRYSGYEFNEEEIFHYYKDVAQATPLPLILYSCQGKTKVCLPPHLVARLAELPTIRYLKDDTADIRYVHDILQATRNDLSVINGWDSIVLESLLLGACGTYSGSVNVVPEIFTTLYHLVMHKNYEEALVYYQKIQPLLALLEDRGRFAAWLKAGMRLRKRDGGLPRKPYLPANDIEIELIRNALLNAGIALAE